MSQPRAWQACVDIRCVLAPASALIGKPPAHSLPRESEQWPKHGPRPAPHACDTSWARTPEQLE